jgi:hypothetical protein
LHIVGNHLPAARPPEAPLNLTINPPASSGQVHCSCYAVSVFLRHIITLVNFKNSLNNINTTNVIIAEIAFGFSKMYFNGQIMKNIDGGTRPRSLNGV